MHGSMGCSLCIPAAELLDVNERSPGSLTGVELALIMSLLWFCVLQVMALCRRLRAWCQTSRRSRGMLPVLASCAAARWRRQHLVSFVVLAA
jgi:hypothetical protein